MGRQSVDQGQLFYEFRLGDRVPADHLLRRIDVIVAAALADLHQKLAAHGIRSERRLREEIQDRLTFRWFCRLDINDPVPDHSTFSKNRHGRFRESDIRPLEVVQIWLGLLCGKWAGFAGKRLCPYVPVPWFVYLLQRQTKLRRALTNWPI